MHDRSLMILLLVLIACIPLSAGQQTVKTVDFLIGHLVTAEAGVSYDKVLLIKIPDGLDEVLNLVIRIEADAYQGDTTVHFRILADNDALLECNPASIKSPPQAVSQYGFVFDCSQLARQGKNADRIGIGFMADKRLHNVRIYAMLTYYNNPVATVSIYGTEYESGHPGTIFLQLLDDDSMPINNASCTLNGYYPSNESSVHPPWLVEAPMLYLDDSAGIYFYDMIAPAGPGVYILSAECSYAYDIQWVYSYFDTEAPAFLPLIGTWYNNNTFPVLYWGDGQYMDCLSTSTQARTCSAAYDFNLSNAGGYPFNVSAIDIYFMGAADNTADLTMSYYNWSSAEYVILPNSITLAGTGVGNVNDFLANRITLPGEAISNSIVRIMLTSARQAPPSYNLWINWLGMAIISSGSSIYELKGSGEVHVSAGNSTSIEKNTDIIVEEIEMGSEMLLISVLFIVAVIILLIGKNTGILFISSALFFTDLVLLAMAGYQMVAMVCLGLMIMAILKIIGLSRNARSESRYV